MAEAVIAVAANAIGSEVAGSLLFAGIIEGSFAVAAVQFGVAALVSSVGQKLIGGSGSSPTPQQRRESIRAAAANRRIVYGEVRAGGVLVYAGSSGGDNAYANLVVVVGQGEIEAIAPGGVFWVADTPGSDAKFAGLIDQYFHLGTDAQTADAALIAEKPTEWTSNHRLRGIAYVYARLKYSANAFPGGLPALSWLVRGRKVYDPRTETTAYSNNWALCVLDYLRSPDGMRCPDELIDFDSFSAAANISDEDVTTLAGSVKRYTLNGVVDLGGTPAQIMQDMLTAGAGKLVFSQGKYRLYAGAYDMPVAGFTLTADMLRDNVTLRTQPTRTDIFNTVRGTYVEPLQDWQPVDYAVQQSAGYLADDDGIEISQNFNFNFTTDGPTAQRLARQALNKIRAATLQVKCNWMPLMCRVWDVVNVELPQIGITGRTFRITQYTVAQGGGIDMTLTEETAAMYAWTAATDETPVPTAPTPTFDTTTVPAVTGLTAAVTVTDLSGTGDGPYTLQLVASWDPVSYGFLTGYEFQFKEDVGGTYGGGITVTSPTAAVSVASDIGYDVRVRALGSGGLTGPWTEATYTPSGGGGGG